RVPSSSDFLALRAALHHEVEDSREVLGRGEPYFDRSALAGKFYAHRSAEPPAELLFGKRDVGRFLWRRCARGSPGGAGLFPQSFDVPHRQTSLDDLDRNRRLSLGRADGKQRPGVTHRELLVFYEFLDLDRQLQQSEGVGYGRPLFADPPRHFLLG